MKELKEDVRLIRECQIRMEEDLKYHIKRTDLLEAKVEPIEKWFTFFKYLISSLVVVIGLLATYNKAFARGVDMQNHLDFEIGYIRLATGCEIHTTSGYRTKEHNKAIGGSEGSYHLKNRARDIIVSNCAKRLRDIADMLYSWNYSVIIYPRHLHFDDREDKVYLEGKYATVSKTSN